MLDDEALHEEVVTMSDLFTDVVFGPGDVPATPIVASVARVVVEVERFEDDDREVMAARGMGMIYTRTAQGRDLRRPSRGGSAGRARLCPSAGAASHCEALGYRVAVDRPYRGTIVPAKFHRREPRVWSLMIEVNRSLLLDGTGERPGPRFESVTADVGRVLASLAASAATHDVDPGAWPERRCVADGRHAARREES